MKLERINPFVKARYEHGYKTLTKFVKDIGISRSKYWTWEAGRITCVRSDSSYDFHKVCKAFEWTDEEGTENLSNLYRWTKNPDIEIVKPNWDDYKHIKPHLGKEVPMCTLDTTNTDISHELELLDNPLVKWRAENNLTKYVASELIGINSTDYALIEDGVFKPASDILTKITEATGLSITQLAKIYKPATVKDIVEDMQTPEYKEMVNEAVEKADEIIDYDKNDETVGNVLDTLNEEQRKAVAYTIGGLSKSKDRKDILDIIHHLLDNRGSEKTEVFHAQLSYRETQEILDIIYGKVTLDEYRSIEIILNR